MTKLQIIARLWSAIYDLIFQIKGTPTKTMQEIEGELDCLEYECRKYADADDIELEIIKQNHDEAHHIRAQPGEDQNA